MQEGAVGDRGHPVIEVRRPGRPRMWLQVREPLAVGRAGDGLILDDDQVSRAHCTLAPTANGLIVTDLGSSNGTVVNGERIARPFLLAPGDEVLVGSATLLVDPDHAAHVEVPVSAMSVPLGGAETASLAASVVGGTLTIVFSDIVDSTAQNAALGDTAWIGLLRRHNQLVREQVAAFNGTEVKGQGDGFLLTFPSPLSGVRFAVALQAALAVERASDPAFALHVRLGVHTGDVLHHAGDIFGQHVNYAARVAAQAQTDEVVVSRPVVDATGAAPDVRYGLPRQVVLKGFDGEHHVVPVVA